MKQCPTCGNSLTEEAAGELCPSCTIRAVLDGEVDFSDEIRVDKGPHISGLTVHEEVGEGGFGVVYRATQTGMVKRRVALKVLKPGVDTRQVLRRFEIERQALALLEHPNIARIYQAGETEEGYPYFTMEFIDGVSITEALAERSECKILESFLSVCHAISYAHGKGVIHRDLKPTNILVTVDGIPKVIDFGVAKATIPESVSGMTLFTGGESWLGTPAYMAPEQADPKKLELDERADVYSLGAIFYEIITGMTPLNAATGRELSAQESLAFIGTKQVPKPSSVSIKEISKDLDVITMRALAPDLEKRYASVLEFSADLRRYMNGDQVAQPDRRKFLTGAAIAGGMASVMIGGFLFRKSWLVEGDEEKELSQVSYPAGGLPFDIVSDGAGERWLAVFRNHEGSCHVIDSRTGRQLSRISSGGKYVRRACLTEQGDRVVVGYLDGTYRWYEALTGRPLSPYRNARDPEIKVVRGVSDFGCDLVHHFGETLVTMPGTFSVGYLSLRHENGKERRRIKSTLYSHAFSPDRRVGLLGSHHGDLTLVNLEDGSLPKILKGHRARFWTIVCSRDGQTFAAADKNNIVGVWCRSGTQLGMFPHDMQCRGIALSPDGSLLATASDDGFSRLWEISSGKVLYEFEHAGVINAIDFSSDGQLIATGGDEKLVRFWNVEKRTLSALVVPVEGAIGLLRFTERTKVIVLTKVPAVEYVQAPLE